MSQVTDLNKTPTADIGPNMSVDEATRRILFIVNQLPNFISGTPGGATAAKQDVGNASLADIDTNWLPGMQATMSDMDNQLITIAAGVPAMAVPGDAKATPTVSSQGAYNSVFNGTTWDRLRSAIVAVTSTLTGFVNSLPWTIYNATPTVRTEAQGGPLQADSSGNLKGVEQYSAQAEDNTNGVFAEAIKPLAVSTYSWTLFQNLGANATLNVKSTAGSIKSIYCHNLASSPAYIQIHKTATTPTGGVTPALSFLVPANGITLIDGQYLGENGYFCTTGIAFAYSTTEITYTAGTAGNQVTQIMYI